MFTTIMYGFINEITRQPACAEIPLRAKPRGEQARPGPQPRQNVRKTAVSTRRRRHLASKYHVLADSFKRAAGFH